MQHVRFALVALNSQAFVALGVMSLRMRRRESYLWVRRLWTVLGLGCAALVVGSLQRLALQAISLGWLPESVHGPVTGDLQLAQSIVVLGLITAAFLTLRRLAEDMKTADRMSASLLDRVRHVDTAKLHLSVREREVLALIGEGITSDADLAAALHISRSTVRSHVKRLLRETGLNRRSDLVAVSLRVGSATEIPARVPKPPIRIRRWAARRGQGIG